MVEIKTKDKTLVLMEIPVKYSNFVIKQYGYAGTWLMETNSKELNHWKTNLKKGEYKIISKLSEISEEQCKEYAENKGTTPWYKNYIKGMASMNWFEFKTAKKSFTTLLQSNNIDLTKEYLILQKL